ncbi:MAG: efflux RND transporter periplasmic adaptor subunit [Planktotalea sp.]|uniref:efflux RND transporter periplasmic adaptor subunit n=1 Tax=Planktotalea sp. TaxID=2029877 RepID=UPI003C73B47D
MKIIPIITAVLVTAFLYLLVFERDELLSFAQADAAEDPQSTTEASDVVTATAPDEADAESDSIRVYAVKSVAQQIDSAVILRGQTEAARMVQVRAETSGQVISEPLRKGTYVSNGQLLCHLDAGTRSASLAEAEARLAEAKARIPETQARVDEAMARLDEAKINDNAASKLSQGGFASETRVASAQASVRAAEAGVASAKSGLESTGAAIQSAEAAIAAVQKDIDRLQVTAPFEGLLETDTSELGSLLQPGGLCATVLQLDPIKLVGFVPETEVDRIEIGALSGARLAGGQEVQGRVTFLSRSADQTTRTFRVEIQVPNKDLSIRDGQTAEIIVSADGTKAHLLPQSALTLNDDGDLGVRTISGDGRAEFVALKLLRDTAKGVWVSGLPEKADVITIGQEYVVDGVAVTPTFEEPKE